MAFLRANVLLAERFQLGPVEHAQVTQTTSVKLWSVPAGRKFRLDRALYINPTGLAEDATNWFVVAVQKGSTNMAAWSTDADEAGTNSIPANTPLELTLSATQADRVAVAGDVISLTLTEGGTATLPAGRIVIEGRLL